MQEAVLKIGELCTGPVGLGTWALGGGRDWGETPLLQAADTIAAAIERGIVLIDTAPVYGSGSAEEIIGKAIFARRKQVLLATKCGICVHEGRPDHDLRPESIVRECEHSLRRLKTDYIDLYQIHWPDPNVPLTEAVGTLTRLQEQGKIRAIGLCNVSMELLRQACGVARITSVQARLSLLDQQALSMATFCREHAISFWAYGVLGGGILTGKYTQMPNLRRCDARRYFYQYYFGEDFHAAQTVALRVKTVAEQKQVPPSAVALAWALAQAGVSGVLVGARTPKQVAENIQALAVRLNPKEREFLNGK